MIEWHPTQGGEMLHAVPRSEHFVNRNSLCFTVCELPPYPHYVAARLAKRRRPLKCSNCLKKLVERESPG